MPTTATPYNYASVDVPQGPAHMWFDCALPGAAATITLHTDGTPDGTLNPNALHLGKLDAGVKFSVKPKLVESVSDESASPYRSNLEIEDAMLTGNWQQNQDTKLLLRTNPGGTRVTGSGFERITGGGLSVVPYYVLLVVWLQPETPGKFCSLILYKAMNTSGLDLDITKKKNSSSPFTFKGYSIDSRALLDQVYQINKQV